VQIYYFSINQQNISYLFYLYRQNHYDGHVLHT